MNMNWNPMKILAQQHHNYTEQILASQLESLFSNWFHSKFCIKNQRIQPDCAMQRAYNKKASAKQENNGKIQIWVKIPTICQKMKFQFSTTKKHKKVKYTHISKRNTQLKHNK